MPFSRFFLYIIHGLVPVAEFRLQATFGLEMPTFERVMEAPKHHVGLQFVQKKQEFHKKSYEKRNFCCKSPMTFVY